MPDDELLEIQKNMPLVACIAYAQATFGSLPKDARAQIRSDKGNYDYDYISEGAIYDRVRAVLSPMGVAVFISVVSTDKRQGGSTWVTIEIRFCKGDETETIRGEAEGVDPRDKSYNKAITTAVRLALTKQFLQGGDLDPEQIVGERTRALPAGPAKLTDSQLKRLTRKAVDSGITTPDGAVDQKLLCRVASYVGGVKVERMDEISGVAFAKMVDGINGKPPALDGYAANPTRGLESVLEMEQKNGW